ncbi:MAG: PDZ domain-containing protein [Phycisphaerales bacterium]|jgi:hypothetical protein
MSKHTVSICVASLGLLAGAAYGQGEAPKAMSGSFDKPLAAEAGSGDVQYSATYTDDGDTYKLEIENGKRTVTHNGEDVPESKLRTRHGKLQVLDDDGKVACEFDLPARRAAAARGRDKGEMLLFVPTVPVPPEAPAAPEAVREQPKVMLGIRMNQGSDGSVEVVQAIPGLSAEKAGVERGDVLVSLDGKEIENLSSIRSILHEKQPGDTVDLVVHRDDKDVTLKLKLQAYESQKLSAGAPGDSGWGGGWSGNMTEEKDWAAEAQKAIESAITEIQKSKNTEKLREEITESLKQAIESIKSAKAEGMNQLQTLGPALAERFQGLQALKGQGNGPGGFRSFTFTAPQADANADQMKALQDKLDKMQERLDQLNEKLDKLVEKH